MGTPAVRLLRHPGPVQPLRRKSVSGEGGMAYRLQLSPGSRLDQDVVGTLYSLGIRNAALNLFGGRFQKLSFCLTAPQAGRTDQIASYTPPIIVDGPCQMIVGSGTLGLDEDGKTPLLHLHVLFADQNGKLRGGHVFPEQTIIGDDGAICTIRALQGIAVRRRFDPETNFSLLQPEPGETSHG